MIDPLRKQPYLAIGISAYLLITIGYIAFMKIEGIGPASNIGWAGYPEYPLIVSAMVNLVNLLSNVAYSSAISSAIIFGASLLAFIATLICHSEYQVREFFRGLVYASLGGLILIPISFIFGITTCILGGCFS